MSVDAWLAVGLTALTIIALIFELAALEVVMLTALTLLMLLGVLTPAQALSGFASPAVLTIGALFVVAAGVRKTGMLQVVADAVFGANGGPNGGPNGRASRAGSSRKGGARAPLLRMMGPAAVASAFLNNTPIVAMFAPVLLDWCRRHQLAPSRMLMPLSYATILGGMCTLIGTSTNLVVDGLMRQHGMAPMGLFEITVVGLPAAVLGVLTIAVSARRLLPDRRSPVTAVTEEGREFLVEMLVAPGSPLVGQSISEAGLRNLPGLFLAAVTRGDHFIGPVVPTEVLQSHDRLLFAGIPSTVLDLQRFPGLKRAPESHLDPSQPFLRGRLYNVVVSPRSSVVNLTIKQASFRSRYEAAVLAVHRAGHRLEQKLGDVRLRAGDTLLLEGGEDFERLWGNSADFAMVSRVEEEPPPMPQKVPVVVTILVALVLGVAMGGLPVVVGAFGAAVAMVLTGVLTARQARRAVSLQVLIVISSAMALGQGLQVTGAADALGQWVGLATQWGPVGVLAATFVMAVLLNGAVGNVAAAAIVFPIAIAGAAQLGIDPRPVAFTVALGSGCSFLSPTVYAANLMVYGPGGYRFTDFARLGVPLVVVVGITTLVVAPWVWPL